MRRVGATIVAVVKQS